MLRRLKITVAYDGSGLAGWQSQLSGDSVQDHLERAAQKITRQQTRVHGAGRTDAGVHALGQCAHLDVPSRGWPAERWISALNASLPHRVRVMRCRYVAQHFHARFDAAGKVYRYRIWNAPVQSPLEFQRSWHVPTPLLFEEVEAATDLFRGRHDFAGFAANRGQPPESTVRTIETVRIRRKGAGIAVEFRGDGFLYKMVRLMVGGIVECGLAKCSVDELRERLAGRVAPKARVSAPAHGLYLVRVRY